MINLQYNNIDIEKNSKGAFGRKSSKHIKFLQFLLDLQPRLEGSYKIGPVHPSIRPSICL